MNYKQLLKHIESVNWYRQGGAIRLFYCFRVYHCVHETIGYDRNIIWQQGNSNVAFFDRDLEYKKAKWVFKQQMKDKKFIDNWIKEWRRRILKVDKYINDNFEKDVNLWTDKELVDFLKLSNRLILESWNKGVLIEWTDPDGLNILLEKISKSGISLKISELELLLAREKLTYVQEEFISRIKLTVEKKQGKNIDKKIKFHAKKFHWYQNNWSDVHEFNYKHFEKLIDNDLKNLSERQKEVEQIMRNIKSATERKIEFYKKNKISADLKNIFYMFSRISEWRDERKAHICAVQTHYFYQILKRIVTENNISEFLSGMLTYNEVKGWKLDNRIIEILKKRSKNAIYFCDANRKCSWLYGDKAKNTFDILVKKLKQKELKGVIANKGVARGKVKIIETRSDFKKMKVGDVLVTSMTRPEFVQLVKMAKAIITNEGGITCHAAIISRELDKPCIIGTQVATEVLKDGDLVEVNANHNIIKILNKKGDI